MRWAIGCAERDGLNRIHRRTSATCIRQLGIAAHTVDEDAPTIVAENEAADFTYQGEPGYMPMIGHLAEAGVVINDEFREGHIDPATQNLEFLQAREALLPQGPRIVQGHLDSAGYPAAIFNSCEETGKTFAIGGRLDAPTRQAIAEIPAVSERGLYRLRSGRNRAQHGSDQKGFPADCREI